MEEVYLHYYLSQNYMFRLLTLAIFNHSNTTHSVFLYIVAQYICIG